jgi:hypothetical protein
MRSRRTFHPTMRRMSSDMRLVRQDVQLNAAHYNAWLACLRLAKIGAHFMRGHAALVIVAVVAVVAGPTSLSMLPAKAQSSDEIARCQPIIDSQSRASCLSSLGQLPPPGVAQPRSGAPSPRSTSHSFTVVFAVAASFKGSTIEGTTNLPDGTELIESLQTPVAACRTADYLTRNRQ